MALKASPDDQALLLELQQFDTRLQQLTHRANNLPEATRVAELEQEQESLRQSIAQRRGTWEDAKAELGRVESDVAVVEGRIQRDSARLEATASVKDVQALEQELASLRKRQSDLEDIQLAVMERVEQEESALAEAERELAELGDRLRTASDERDAALDSIENEREHVHANRMTVAGKTPKDLLALYERQRERYGVGASHLRGGVSSASGVALTESDMATIRAAEPDDVLLCPDSNAVLIRTSESGL